MCIYTNIILIIFLRLSNVKNRSGQVGYLIIVSIYILVITCLLAWILAKKSKIPLIRKGEYQGLIIFGNQGFLGYAVCYSLFSKEEAMYTAIFNIPFLFLIWTYGVYLMAKDKASFSWRLVPAFYHPKPVLLTIALLITAMLCAPTTPLFAQKYGGDTYFGSIGVCLSTILKVISLPFLYSLLQSTEFNILLYQLTIIKLSLPIYSTSSSFLHILTLEGLGPKFKIEFLGGSQIEIFCLKTFTAGFYPHLYFILLPLG